MAAAQGVSPATIQRIWEQHKLQPHRVESFKFSTDPQFVTKVRDIVGLYVNPPDRAIVLSVDEKSQIQALTGRNLFFRCDRACPSARHTIMSGTGPPRCSQRLTS